MCFTKNTHIEQKIRMNFANLRLDMPMREPLAEMTGWLPEVIRLWFQNKRGSDNNWLIP